MESEEPSLPAVRCIAWLDLFGVRRLFEHEVSNSGFEVPINYRDRREINAAWAHITIQIRPVIAKIVPKASPVIIACSTPRSPRLE